MIEVGDTLKNSREVSGVTLEEVSTDLEIPVILLEQIEDGNMGAFKDVFELKDYIRNGGIVLAEINAGSKEKTVSCSASYIVIYDVDKQGNFSILNPNDKDYKYVEKYKYM